VSQPWTRPAQVRALVEKRWRSGALLTAFAEGRAWEPVSIPLRGPAAGEIAGQLAEVQRWAAEWAKAGRGPLRVECKKVGGRHVGANTIPSRAWIDGYDEAWQLLGVGADVQRFRELLQVTAQSCPRLVGWLARRPVQALRLADRWGALLATVRWIEERQSPGMYLRQVDVPGVDTKFIERHTGVLAELLDLQLAPDRIDAGAADFAGRYRFCRKPGYVRFRCPGLLGFSELSVRAEELTVPPAGVGRVYVVENEITYLAFPLPAAAMVIFGGGYAVDVLAPLGWLAGLDLVYWGDIDTHGFAILNRLRLRFGHARSILMDRPTLLAHRSQWVTESQPTAVRLDLLDAAEADLYRDLVDGAFGPSVRLEQERIGFAALEQALALTDGKNVSTACHGGGHDRRRAPWVS
jgi:hypothetical protein